MPSSSPTACARRSGTPDAAPFLHGSTYAGHPAACVAGLANIDILEREGLVERAAALEPVLAGLLEPLLELPGVAEVRCTGLAAAVELDGDLLAAHPAAGPAAVLAARRHGVISRLLRGVALQISPPLVVTEDELGADRRRDRRRRDRDVLAAALSPHAGRKGFVKSANVGRRVGVSTRMHDCGDPGTGEIVYLLAELRSEERGAVHEIGSRARVLGVEGTELTLAVTGCSGEAIISCPQSLVVPERRSLAARRRTLRADARAATA